MKPTAWKYPRAYGSGLSFVKPDSCCDADGEPVEPTPLYAIPEGWALVPKEPTPEMVDAFCPRGGTVGEFNFPAAYRAMLDAAPNA